MWLQDWINPLLPFFPCLQTPTLKIEMYFSCGFIDLYDNRKCTQTVKNVNKAGPPDSFKNVTNVLDFSFRIWPGCESQGLAIQITSFLNDLEGLFFKLCGKGLALPFPQLELEW